MIDHRNGHSYVIYWCGMEVYHSIRQAITYQPRKGWQRTLAQKLVDQYKVVA